MGTEAAYKRTLTQFTALADDKPTYMKLALVLHDIVRGREGMRKHEFWSLGSLFDMSAPCPIRAIQDQRINLHSV